MKGNPRPGAQPRKLERSLSPLLDVPIVLELAVLGAIIYTSERSHFCFSEARLKKILDDTDNIAALPVGRATKAFLIGAKIVPQMSFGAHITKIPQQALKKIQNAVAKALWVGQRGDLNNSSISSFRSHTEPTL